MNPKQISQDDLVLFALQDLTPAEAAEVLVHLEHSETARAELAQIQGDLAMLALTSDLQSPPAQARERLLNRVAREKKVLPMERPAAVETTSTAAASNSTSTSEGPMLAAHRGRLLHMGEEAAPPRSRMGFAGWAGWAIAAGLLAGVGFEYHQQQSLKADLYSATVKLTHEHEQAARAEAVMQVLNGGGAMQVALQVPASGTAEPPKPAGHAAYIANTGSLVFVGEHLAPLEAYKTYELWVIPVGGHPVPAGLFKPDQQGFASVVLPELPKGVAAKTFGVTIEDDGGVAQPTMKNLVLLGM
jgi:hypothetical protein